MTQVRSVTVKVEVDTNKDTSKRTFALSDYDSIEDMMEAAQEWLEQRVDR